MISQGKAYPNDWYWEQASIDISLPEGVFVYPSPGVLNPALPCDMRVVSSAGMENIAVALDQEKGADPDSHEVRLLAMRNGSFCWLVYLTEEIAKKHGSDSLTYRFSDYPPESMTNVTFDINPYKVAEDMYRHALDDREKQSPKWENVKQFAPHAWENVTFLDTQLLEQEIQPSREIDIEPEI